VTTAAGAHTSLRVALGEYDTGWHDPEGSLRRAAALVRRAAAGGAGLVVLPEMCTTGFTMDAASQAEEITGPGARGLAVLARQHDTSIVAGLALREGESAVNAAVVFDRNGRLAGIYRKQRLFAYANEPHSYSPGEFVTTIGGVRAALFVCYDLRFPELFRAVAGDVELIVVIANWPAARRAHWDVLVRARAIENLCYVVAVNRTGTGGALSYDGGSVAWSPWGERLPDAGNGEPALVDIAVDEVTRVRTAYPFLADR
jgi:omega-amidase